MLVLLLLLSLFRDATLASASGTPIPITLYTDNSCDTPSATAANVSIEIGVCVVTPGLGSFVLNPFPCSSGSVTNWVFSDVACGETTTDFQSAGGNCFHPLQGGLAAIMLSCNQDNPGQPTATTTITVGAIATGGASPTGTSGSGVGSSGSGTSSGSSSSSNSDSLASGWDALSPTTRIVIIIALAVGIPSAVIGGLWRYYVQRRNVPNRDIVLVEEAPPPPIQMYSSTTETYTSVHGSHFRY